MFTPDRLIFIVISALCFVPAIVLHEVAHGFVASKLGDPTARDAGRLTLNPVAHIDPFGTVILPLMMAVMGGPVFGYAKPVPYNPRYFKDRRKGDLLVGLAGPAANLLMALAGAGVMWALLPLAQQVIGVQGDVGVFYYFYLQFLPLFVIINLYLMFFNLLPIPPLDGSSVFAVLVPEQHLATYYAVERYAMPVFLIVAIVLPYAFGINPFAWYLDATAGNVASIILPV